MLFLMACTDVSIGNPCDAGFVLSEPSLYTYSLTMPPLFIYNLYGAELVA